MTKSNSKRLTAGKKKNAGKVAGRKGDLISLHPLSPEEAITDLLKIRPQSAGKEASEKQTNRER